MLTHGVFAVFVGCLVLLLGYAASMLSVALLAWRRPHSPKSPSTADAPAVTVLVPSHHEGEALVDTVRTLLAQDHPGPVSVWILVADASDASVAALARAWPEPWDADPRDDRRRCVTRAERREVFLVACAVAPKREKLNLVLPSVTTPYVAVLDADHRAAPAWLSSALGCMHDCGVRAVQSRRRPLSTLRIAQMWDSAQNHVGNEALNRALSRAQHSVFFTGTTAVFATEVLRSRRFAASITEDTYLSLDLVCDGERIAYDGASGSYEEVAPGLGSFVARRRRWAAGHTHAFFAHLRAILRRRPAHAHRWVLVLHGLFYLVPLVVLVSLWAEAIHALVQFPASLLAVWGLATALLAGLLLAAVGARGRRLADAIIALAWCAPQAAFASVYLYAWSGAEGYYYLLAFPHQDALRWPIAVALAAPLASLLLAIPPLGGMRVARVVLLVVTYPLMLFVDSYAALLGICDVALGRAAWTRIRRENVVAADAVPETMRRTMTTATLKVARFGWLLAVPAVTLFAVLANDLLSRSECGEIRPFLWRPLLVKRSHPVDLAFAVTTKRTDADHLEAVLVASVRSATSATLALTWLVDGARIEDDPVEGEGGRREHSLALPLGWERHAVGVELRGDGFTCRRARAVSTDVKEIVGRDFLVNGEPFVVKGVIPSFSTSRVGLDYATGLAQIKAAGANAVRIYHEPGRQVLDAASHEQLLVLAQPDRSTWENVDLDSARDRDGLVERYRALVADTDGFPYLLMDSIGNELELRRALDASTRNVREIVDHAREPAGAAPRFPLAYSTYYTFVEYPVDVAGVNMLDTGPTYWDKALALIRSRGKPFFATELGGFVAFYERPTTALRVARLREQWDRLRQAGAMGAFFFESHDNWAQAVPPGEVNDPLAPDQPDDLRGFWDEKNRPKPELATLERLFADIAVRSVARALPPGAGEAEVVLTNVRPYALRGVHARIPGGPDVDVGDLAAREERTARLPIGAGDDVDLTFLYTTHHGLAARSHVTFRPPRVASHPVVLDVDFTETARGPASLRGTVVDGGLLGIMIPPDWHAVVVNGRRFERPDDGRIDVSVEGPYHEVEELVVSRDGRSWSPWRPHVTAGGRWLVRFRLPPVGGESLLLGGVGAGHVRLTARGETRDVPTHSYRDNVIDIAGLGVGAGDEIQVEIDRDEVEYVAARLTPSNKAILVELERPLVFGTIAVDIARP